MPGITLAYQNSPVEVGAGTYNNSFDGFIDDLRIYDRALGSAEIADLAVGGCGPGVGLDAESFSPANTATGVATNANLSLTFGTTTVATSTGSIGIYKTADNSLVESFAANSPRITRSTTVASTTFTITPSAALAASTSYYVSVASTTFQNGVGSFWAGTVASSTWSFTTGLNPPAPVITPVVASVVPSGSNALPWCSAPSAPGWDPSLPGGGCAAPSTPASSSLPARSCAAYSFTRTLRYGMKGEDVRALQKLMNCLGFALAADGPGSAGEETNLFVERTFAAVKKFQEAYATDILAPLSEIRGTGIFALYSQKKARALTQ